MNPLVCTLKLYFFIEYGDLFSYTPKEWPPGGCKWKALILYDIPLLSFHYSNLTYLARSTTEIIAYNFHLFWSLTSVIIKSLKEALI